ncbi:MAG: CAP domain-containing protein [Pseudomonadota bacterium]
MRGIFAAVLLLASVSATAADACGRATLPGDVHQVIPQNGIDDLLLDVAIRAEVNRMRCGYGLPPVNRAPDRLASVANDHSVWMAGSGRLSHKSTARGRQTLGQRIAASQVRVQVASENLAVLPRYRFGDRRFFVENAGACRFKTTRGETVKAHTYYTMSKEVVARWMASPGHRRNILDPSARALSTAGAGSQSGTCGRVWITQKFVG